MPERKRKESSAKEREIELVTTRQKFVSMVAWSKSMIVLNVILKSKIDIKNDKNLSIDRYAKSNVKS